jgi:homoserine O-acetyltransferase
MMIVRRVVLVVALASVATVAGAQGEQLYAELGDFRLESGEVIRDLKIGYRTFGELNAERSNAVLFPTWFTGTTGDLVEQEVPGKLVDSSKYFVILIDAIGDGVSTSPSNSSEQPGMRFPRFTIGDMVRSQHAVLTRNLGIEHLRAVMGVSMGAMQTFQWAVSYPGFMDKAIPIAGSTRLSSYDRLLFAPVVALESPCGHLAIWCEQDEAFPLIARFLEE